MTIRQPGSERSGSDPNQRGGTEASSSLRRGQAVRELLQNRNFALLWFGELFSQIGDKCLIVAGISLVSDLSSSPLAMLAPALSIAAPQLLFGLVGGVIADRMDRKVVMVAANILRALLVLPILLISSLSQIWILYLAAAGLAMVGVSFYPARNASLPKIVPEESLVTANGLIQGSTIVAMVVGPALAGVVIEIWFPSAILIDSATFLISALAIGLMAIPKRDLEGTMALEDGAVWEDIKAGLSFIYDSQVLRRVLAVTGVATLGVAAVILLAIPHLKAELGAGGLEYGFTMSVLGLGSLLGSVMVTRFSHRLSTSTLVGGMLVLAGVAIVAFAYAPSYLVVLGSVVIIGMCLVVARGTLNTITQTLAPDDIRGRVQSAVNMIVVASTALSEGLSAVMGSVVGVQTVFMAAGLITCATGLAAIFVLRSAGRIVRPAVQEVG